ncbi:MAG: cation diffusion facilitator family transporter [Spirochaetales bacterium]|jgi:cation diffusion facilitator family transporter|nr:cation diffusion facilitator family transporter [Spirochaetales bacterium]
MTERLQGIRRASLIGLWGNAVLAASKIGVGIFADSLAVVGDGLDSSTDVVISFMTLMVARYMAKPSDKEHPFGHGRAETIATSALAFIVFFAGAQLLVRTVGDLLYAPAREIPHAAALWVTGVSIAGKLLLAWSQRWFGKRYKSDMLLANSRNMQGDVFISAAILIGLFFSVALDLPVLDPVTALLVSLWILHAGLDIFRKVNMELMDGNTDRDLYRAIFEAVRTVEGAGNPHRARIRKIASYYDIDLDIEVKPYMRVDEAHGIAVRVERAIRGRIENVFDVMVHVEPEGNTEENESYGLSENEILEEEKT